MDIFYKDDGTKGIQLTKEEIRRNTTTHLYGPHPIARYMDLNKFYSLITSESLWFSRADFFTDELDGLAVVDPENEIADKFRKSSYINCWNLFNHESLALWHSFVGRDKGGVILVSTVSDVENCFDEKETEFINPLRVQYVDLDERYDGINNELLVSRKKIYYTHEQEIRFNYYKGIPVDPDKTGILVNVDTKRLIKNIILSPYMPPWMEATVKDILKKYGLNPELRKSGIRDHILR